MAQSRDLRQFLRERGRGVQCYDYEETIAILLKQLAKFSEPAQATMACGVHKRYKRRYALTNIHFED